jgi:hypothetical protein
LKNLNGLKGENSTTEEILPQEDFIKFYKNLNSRDKDHNSVQRQIIEEFVSLKNNFNMSEVIGDLNNEISIDEIIEDGSNLSPFLCNRTKKLSFQIFGKVPFLNIRLKWFY